MNLDAEVGFADAIKHYSFWRKIANEACRGSYDEPDRQNDRMYFRSDYSEKLKKWPEWAESGDWGAWIIDRVPDYFCVLSSLKHERAAQRDESIKVFFSKFSDAAKYVIMRIGDSVRVDLRLTSQFVKWDDRGPSPRILVEPADRQAISVMKTESPTPQDGFIEEHLKRYTFEEDRSSYGYAFPEDQPRMEVLALSFDELTTTLLEDIPESVTAEIPRWRP